MNPDEQKKFTRISEIEAEIRADYGRLLGLPALARVLGTSHAAVQRANQRGELPIQVTRAVGRRGYVAAARNVALYLASLED